MPHLASNFREPILEGTYVPRTSTLVLELIVQNEDKQYVDKQKSKFSNQAGIIVLNLTINQMNFVSRKGA